MRVVIYASAARVGGARTHLMGLVPELAVLAPEDAFLLIAQPGLIDALPRLPANWECRAERAQQRGFLGRLRWEQAVLPRTAKEWGADVLLSFGSFVPLQADCARVLEAGNALPFTRAYWLWVAGQSLRVQAEELARWLLLRSSLLASTRVLVPTRAMRQDVVTRVHTLADRVDVVLWGVSDLFRIARWQGPGSGVILGVSKHGVNKEFDVLVAAFARLASRYPDVRLQLTGTVEESRWSRETAALALRLGIADRLVWTGDVPNDQVPALLERAELLVFPTWCESFGLPLAEGLAVGVPAVAGDIPACREVGGDASLYYRPGSADDLAEAIGRLIADRGLARDLSERGRARGLTYRWRANAEGTLATLRRAMGQHRARRPA